MSTFDKSWRTQTVYCENESGNDKYCEPVLKQISVGKFFSSLTSGI